jgi:hypothetical protein
VKRKPIIIIAAVLAVLAGGAAYYRYFPGRTPAGQPPVARLDPASFDWQFRAASADTRVLALLSPT